MTTRKEAARRLWKDWKSAAVSWWRAKSSGSAKEQTSTWIAAVGIPAALIGLAMCPRLTVLACAGAFIWTKIEERRK